MGHDYLEDAKVFKALCDENRLQILEMLRSGEKCACRLLDHLDIGQSTLSHHMKILCDSGIVVSRSEGKWTYYSISAEGSDSAKHLLDVLTAEETVLVQQAKGRIDSCRF
ncbi:MAG: ArsR/SmtB family transcription factor [Saccharofermentanales bacterium]